MNIKNLLYLELINGLIDKNIKIIPGDTLRLHLDISIAIDNQRYNQLLKDIYEKAIERNLLKSCWLAKVFDERPVKTKRQKKLTLPGQEHH